MCPTFILGRGLANAAVAAGCAPGAVLVFGTFAAILGEDESDRGIVRFARIGTDRWTGSDEHWDEGQPRNERKGKVGEGNKDSMVGPILLSRRRFIQSSALVFVLPARPLCLLPCYCAVSCYTPHTAPGWTLPRGAYPRRGLAGPRHRENGNLLNRRRTASKGRSARSTSSSRALLSSGSSLYTLETILNDCRLVYGHHREDADGTCTSSGH